MNNRKIFAAAATTIMLLVSVTMLLAQQPTTAPATLTAAGEKRVTPSGLTIVVTKPGGGARVGDTVWVQYEGRLTNGTKFDSSYDRQEPAPVVLGQGSVIRGWEEGLLGMEVGEKRQLVVPPDLAYGPNGRGDKIPPNSTLVFDIEMIGIRRG
jgi:peptidylprolyl isomerase